MKKLLLVGAIVLAMTFGCIRAAATTNTNPKPTPQAQADVLAYDQIKLFGEDSMPYNIPKEIGVNEEKWQCQSQPMTPNIVGLGCATEDLLEAVTLVAHVKERKLLLLIWGTRPDVHATPTMKFYIYDGKPFPVEVDEQTAQKFFELNAKRDRGVQ